MSAARATASATPPRMASALWLYVPIAVLVGLGVVMVASATLHAGDAEPSMTLFTRHVQFLTAAIGLGILAWVVPVSAWRFAAPYLFLGALALLAIVLVPGVGRTANGATRWIPLIAGINLQPSEWMKLASIVFLAAYLDNRHDELGQPVRGFWMPLVLLAVAAGLLLLEPDFGTLFVVVATGLGLLFLAGMPLAQFTGMLLAFAVAAAAAVMMAPYRVARVMSFHNPWEDPLATGYQLVQSLIAFGRGGVEGVGLGAGVQKLFYLPEAHNDFVLAVIGEELGLIGTLTVIALIALVALRGLALARRAHALKQDFAAWVAAGIALWIGLQGLVHVGVNLGVLPTKGLTLPFVSFGGNALLVLGVAVGLLARIDYETAERRVLEGGGR